MNLTRDQELDPCFEPAVVLICWMHFCNLNLDQLSEIEKKKKVKESWTGAEIEREREGEERERERREKREERKRGNSQRNIKIKSGKT